LFLVASQRKGDFVESFDQEVENAIAQVKLEQNKKKLYEQEQYNQNKDILDNWYKELLEYCQRFKSYFVISEKGWGDRYKCIEVSLSNKPIIQIVPQMMLSANGHLYPNMWLNFLEYNTIFYRHDDGYGEINVVKNHINYRLKQIAVYNQTGVCL